MSKFKYLVGLNVSLIMFEFTYLARGFQLSSWVEPESFCIANKEKTNIAYNKKISWWKAPSQETRAIE